MYRDYAVAPDLFHWESQSTTSVQSPTGQRYLKHQAKGSHVFLFVRHRKQDAGRTAAYTCLGARAALEVVDSAREGPKCTCRVAAIGYTRPSTSRAARSTQRARQPATDRQGAFAQRADVIASCDNERSTRVALGPLGVFR